MDFVEGGFAKITAGMPNTMLACLVPESLNFRRKPEEKNLAPSAGTDSLYEEKLLYHKTET